MSMGHLPRQHRPSPLWPLVLLVVLLSACCLHCWLLFLPPAFSRPPSFIPLWLINSAGPSAPFHRAGSYFPPPSHCRLAQVHVLQRHGSRYPTSHVGQSIQAALWKLQRVASQLDPSLEFVKSYRYQLAEALLVPLGVRESFDAGSEFAQRYASLVNSELPFIRASLSTRVVDSATNFTAGLLCHLKLPYNQSSLQPLLISERENSNNPLDNNACPKAHASEEPQIWLETFAIPLAQKLNQLAPGAALNTNDIIALMKLCIFDSIAVEKESEFCRLFSKKNWESFEYYFDLKKIYDHGIRNPLARLQGSGYVAELLSRLTGQREWVQRDQTKVNHTLDESEKGFPLGLKSYVDFTHDNQMVSIFSSLGIQEEEYLPPTGPPPKRRSWIVSNWVPFAGRLAIEKVVCDKVHKAFVRFILNDQVLFHPSCPRNLNMCSLDHFVTSRREVLRSANMFYHVQCQNKTKQ